MPGRPIIQQAFAALDAAEDEVFDAIANGENMAKLAKRLTGRSKRPLYEWLHASPEREARWATVKALRAEAYDEKAGEVLDAGLSDPVLSAPHAGLIREKSGYYRYMAKTVETGTRADSPAVALGIQADNLTIENLAEALVHVARKPGVGTPALPPPSDEGS